MGTIFVKPIAGVLVRYPQTMTPLAAEGALVELDTFWRRRIADGTVVVVEKAVASKPEIVETESAATGEYKRRSRQ